MERNAEARNIYLRLSQLRPNDVDIWIEFGTIAWELGDFRRVAECSSRITALGPDRFEGYMLRAINERHKGNMPEAIQHVPRGFDPRDRRSDAARHAGPRSRGER